MSQKTEKKILAVLVLIMGSCLVLQYIVGVDNFSDPVSAKYWLEMLLYPSVLVSLVLVWRQTLDKKIRSKKEREEDFQNMKEEK